MYIEGMDEREIIEVLSKSSHPVKRSRVYQVLSANAAWINPRIAWPKSKRIHLRQRLIMGKLTDGSSISKRDILDHIDGLKIEIEGEKPLIDNSQHMHYTIHHLSKEVNENHRGLEEPAPEALPGPGVVLAESAKRFSVEETNGDHGSGAGQPEGNGKVS